MPSYTTFSLTRIQHPEGSRHVVGALSTVSTQGPAVLRHTQFDWVSAGPHFFLTNLRFPPKHRVLLGVVVHMMSGG